MDESTPWSGTFNEEGFMSEQICRGCGSRDVTAALVCVYEVAGVIFVSTRYFGYRTVTYKGKDSQIVGSVI